MNRALCTIALAAAALAGCEQETITGNGPYDPQANASANSTAVVLPPSIASSHAYRCKDNSLVYIDLLSDRTTARLRAERGGPATVLTAPEAGQPYVAEGHELVATLGNKTVTLTRPGAGKQTCNA